MERLTKQRDAIFNAIASAKRPLSIAEILVAGQKSSPTLSIATVYRTIKSLLSEKSILPVKLPGEPDRYEVNELDAHHHFKCDVCHKVFDIHEKGIDQKLLAPAGYVVEKYDLIVYGHCIKCRPVGGRSATGRRAG